MKPLCAAMKGLANLNSYNEGRDGRRSVKSESESERKRKSRSWSRSKCGNESKSESSRMHKKKSMVGSPVTSNGQARVRKRIRNLTIRMRTKKRWTITAPKRLNDHDHQASETLSASIKRMRIFKV